MLKTEDYNMLIRESVLDVCREIAALDFSQPIAPSDKGICLEVKLRIEKTPLYKNMNPTLQCLVRMKVRDTIEEISTMWPEYSGHQMYPVPSPKMGLTAMEMYNKAWCESSMYEGEYGELRKELAIFILNTLEAEK